MADNVAITEGSGKTIAGDDVGGVIHQRVKVSIGADGSATDWSDAAPAQVKGGNFVVSVTPTVTNGAYSAGDIVGALIEPVLGRAASSYITLQSIIIALKAAVTSNLTVVIFSADPSSTTKTDNAAYSLNAADAFKVRAVVTSFTLTDHGTPNTYQANGLNLVLQTDASQKIQCLILDGTGFTLTSTSDLQITFTGYQD